MQRSSPLLGSTLRLLFAQQKEWMRSTGTRHIHSLLFEGIIYLIQQMSLFYQITFETFLP